MSRSDQDRGMRAVARVRDVRERDSRLGLLQALQSVREREATLERLQESMSRAATPDAPTMDDFVSTRQVLAAAALAVREAERRLESARTVATEAHGRWQADKTRARAVEHLLQERALQRAEAARRAEVRQVDDIVGAAHTRTRGLI